MAPAKIAIGVDVGGSGIKAAVVDVAGGDFASERLRVATPDPSTAEAIVSTIDHLVGQLVEAMPAAADAPIGIGLPGVVMDGVMRTATNIDASWLDFPIAERLAASLDRGVAVINDADAAGIAEMRFGAGRGKEGVVIVLTLGTGVGSGTFIDGVLVPNTEFGLIDIRGKAAEKRSSAAARVRRGLSYKEWAADLTEHITHIDRLTWPNLIILGGGISKNGDKFIPRLEVRPPVVAATLRNHAGIIGAALHAAERSTGRPRMGTNRRRSRPTD